MGKWSLHVYNLSPRNRRDCKCRKEVLEQTVNIFFSIFNEKHWPMDP